MKKIKYLIVFIIISFISINVKAVNCSTDELNNLKELANNVEIIYDYQIEEDKENKQIDVYYTIQVLNMNEDLQFRFDKKTPTTVSEITNNSYREGEKLTVSLYSYTEESCTNDLLRTLEVDFPYYNSYYYYNKDKCNTNPNFKYCQEFMYTYDKTFDEIDKLFNDYLNGDSSNNINNNTENNYLIYIAISAIFVVLITVIIIIIIKRKKKLDI